MTTLTTIVPDPAPPVTLLETAPVTAPVAGTQLVSTLGWNNLITLLQGTSVDEIDLDALEALTTNRALVTDAGGHIIVSAVTDTELALLSGVTILGDMILASAQTNTGIKTFLDTTMKLRNVANTFDAFFVNTVTADRIITIPDAAGTMIITGLANQITNTELTAGAFAKITGVGTIASGTWQGTVVASAFLDVDTMHLSVAQTVNGAKTFLDTNFLLRNVANTFNGSFVNTNTANRIYTLPDVAGTVSLIAATETLLNKILTTPTIVATGFTNMQHTHQAANTGGQLVATLALTATGTKDSTTFLRGDDTWAVPPGGSSLPVPDTTSIAEGSIDATKEVRFEVDGNTTGIIGVIATIFTTAKTVTLPNVTDTLMGKTTTDVMTNKSYALGGTGNVLTGTAAQFDTAVTDDNFAFVSDNLSVFALTTSAQLAGVIQDETGSGFLVFGTSPTIVTPTIASFTNATHNHSNAAGGGQLTNSALVSGVFAAITGLGVQSQGLNMNNNNVTLGTGQLVFGSGGATTLDASADTDILTLTTIAGSLHGLNIVDGTAGSIKLVNINSGSGRFFPTFLGTLAGNNTAGMVIRAELASALDTGSEPVIKIGARPNDGGSIDNRPILRLENVSVNLWEIDNDGTVDQQGNNLIGLGDVTLDDASNIILNATTGTKIGTATAQKLGFWNVTPVVQPSHIADPSGGATIDAEARTAINSILAQLATTGMQAAS